MLATNSEKAREQKVALLLICRSELLEEAQIAGVQPADVVNAMAHHAEALHPQARGETAVAIRICLLYTSPSPRDGLLSRMPSSA